MANAKRDENFKTTLLVPSAISSTTLLEPTATPIAGVNPLNVAIVDGSGSQITSFGGGSVTQGTSPWVTSNANIDVALSTRLKPADTLAGVTLVATVGTITNAVTVTQSTGSNLHTVIDSGTITTITNTVSTSEVSPTTISNGKTTVTTAGTRVTLASSTAVKSVTIKALVANTGTIYVGNSSVASSNGYALAPGDSVSFDIANLNTVNIDSSVNGEGCTYIAIN